MSTQKYFPIYTDHLTTQCLKDNLDIDITPFTQCNLNCPFCEVSSLNAQYDPTWFDWSIEALSVLINQSTAKTITVAIAGGEIMHDRLFDYEKWDVWFTQLRNIVQDTPCKISVITNLITHKIDQLIDLQKKHKFCLGTSFDFEGRFTKQKQVDLFLQNLKTLTQNHIDITIATLANKQNFLALKNKNHWLYSTFEYLYNNYVIGIEQYTDVHHLPHYNLTDDQLIEFYKFVIREYPKIKGLEKYSNYKDQWHNCSKDTIDIKPFHVSWSCCNKTAQFAKMFDKFGCLTCKYLHRCAPNCPTDAISHQKCIDKEMYEFFEEFKN